MAEPDKYIVDMNQIVAPDGTESLPVQQAQGGENTTFRIILSNLKKYIFTDAPSDGQAYVRVDGEWVLLDDYLP